MPVSTSRRAMSVNRPTSGLWADSQGSSNRGQAVSHSALRFGGAPMSGPSILSDDEDDELLKQMARKLSALARWDTETNQRVIVLFEGRDTAGKGGSIEMIRRVLNPRQ